MQSVPKDVSAVPRPVRVTRPLGWYTTTPEGVTLVGAGMNVFLAALKLVAGMVAGSASLVADAGHSLSDLVTDAVCMLALRLRNKRAEALCTLSIGSILCATGIGMTSAAGMALISPTRAGAACGAHLAATVRGSQGAALLVAILSVISCAAPPAPLLACSLSSVSRAVSASGTSRHQYRATLRGACAWGSAHFPAAPSPPPLLRRARRGRSLRLTPAPHPTPTRKEWLFRITHAVGTRTAAPTLVANAFHHRSDALSSVAAIGGVGGAHTHIETHTRARARPQTPPLPSTHQARCSALVTSTFSPR